MIPRLSSNFASFTGGKQNSVRDMYYAHLNSISKTAQMQTSAVMNPVSASSNLNNPIPMQGTGQKLDTQA